MRNALLRRTIHGWGWFRPTGGRQWNILSVERGGGASASRERLFQESRAKQGEPFLPQNQRLSGIPPDACGGWHSYFIDRHWSM
jgi:hypothetical protein